MKKITVKIIGSIILLFCMSHLQAQYVVFDVKGSVEMSIDGKKWEPVKKKAELKEPYQIRLQENALIDIIDSKNLIYSYAEPKIISVGDIIKKRKTIFEALNENSGKRKAIGGVERGDEAETLYHNLCLFFTDTETLNLYDNQDLIPEGSVFYITIFNSTKEDKTANVYQKLEDGELIPCFPEDITIAKNSSAEIKNLLFAKQANNKFVVIPKDK